MRVSQLFDTCMQSGASDRSQVKTHVFAIGDCASNYLAAPFLPRRMLFCSICRQKGLCRTQSSLPHPAGRPRTCVRLAASCCCKRTSCSSAAAVAAALAGPDRAPAAAAAAAADSVARNRSSSCSICSTMPACRQAVRAGRQARGEAQGVHTMTEKALIGKAQEGKRVCVLSGKQAGRQAGANTK